MGIGKRKKEMNNQPLKNKAIYLLLITGMAAIMLLVIGLLATTAAASSINAQNESVAQDFQGSNLLSHGGSFNGCMVERYNQINSASETSLNCTANDVSLAAYSLMSGPSSCIEGEDITVTLLSQFVSTASERWDVGLFVSTDGGDPNTLGGKCYNDYLHPTSTDNTDLNLSSGFGLFYNGEINEDPSDTCGDIQQGQNAFFQTAQITIKCEDSNDNGIADVKSCTVWSNATSDGSDKKSSCTSESDTTAETKAKCTCSNVEITGLKVPQSGTIEVIKTIDPVDAPGAFNLQIDGVTEFTDAGNGDSTGPVSVSAGYSTDDEPIGDTHTVGEIAGTGTDLQLYDPVINCQDQENDTEFLEGAGPLEVFVEPGDAWVCTITNTYLVIETETPVTETPVTETPVTETPVTETPVTETPVTETPVTETPVTETPVTETATTDPPTTTTPTEDVRTPTPPPTLPQPTSVVTSQVLIPQTGLDLTNPGDGTSFWFFLFMGLGLVGTGIVFHGVTKQIKRR
jgi:cell division septation protein DedD